MNKNLHRLKNREIASLSLGISKVLLITAQMQRRIIYLVISCLTFCIDGVAQTSDVLSLLNVDHKKLISRADLLYDKPVTKSEEGMPVGNGVVGSLVWTTPSAIHLQLNRADVFANNSASNNFYERHTDYCNGVGFVDLDLVSSNREIFTSSEFQQHLSCFDGVVTVKGKEVTAKVMAWQKEDVMAIQVEDVRNSPLPVLINLRTLRLPVTKNGDHLALSKVSFKGNRIILTQEFKEGSYYCGSAVVIDVSGRQSKASIENESTARLSIEPGSKTFLVLMASAASFDPNEDLVAIASQKLDAATGQGFDDLLKSNQQWWSDFWKKSFIHLQSDDQEAGFIEKNYTYYLYVMASSSRGKYPAKFNGMLWTTGGDSRKWGNLYWGANQSCLYNALFQTNHPELLAPMFNMYTSSYNNLALAAHQQWGSEGIFIPETMAIDGLAPLPEDIAAEMRELYLLRKSWTERSPKFINYAYTKMPFLSRWNWKKDEGWKDGVWNTSDKGGGTFGHVTHIFSRGAKIAYQYWLQYEYTQDLNWLRNNAYPMIKGVAEFYRNFPNVKKEKDGKYHIHHINDNESVWGGHNTIEEISSMMGIFPVAVKAAEILNVDRDLSASWKEIVNNLSPLPVSTDYNNTGKAHWVRSLPPMVQGSGDRSPDPNTMPVWFFDLCTLESEETVLETANATFDTYFPSGINAQTKIYVLSKLAVAGSLLGRSESTRYLLPNQIRTEEAEVMPNRMDLREGFQTTSIQRLGRVAEALQYALCQSVPSLPGKDPVLHVFPAWPREWDSQYMLLCRNAFLVSSSMRKGQIDFVEVVSQAGRDLHIKNPWPGSEVVIYRNGKDWKSSKQERIVLQTKAGDRLTFVKNGDTLDVLIKNRINVPFVE
jgi:hypothetical protein